MVHSPSRLSRALLCLLLLAKLMDIGYGFTIHGSTRSSSFHRKALSLRVVNEQDQNKEKTMNSSPKGSGNLITLLNFAQEVGNSNNERFRRSADRLREQFVKSFALKYELNDNPTTGSPLAMSDVLIDTLSNINDSELLCTEAKCIRQIINMQLDGIDPLVDPSSTLNTEKDKKELTNIIFFNEDIDILHEYRYTAPFPSTVCRKVTLNDQPLPLLVTSSNTAQNGLDINSGIDNDGKADDDGGKPQRRRKRDILRANLGRFIPFLQPKGIERQDKEEEKEQVDDVFANIVEGQREDLVQALQATEDVLSSVNSVEAQDRTKQVVAANIAATLLRAKKAREAANPTLIAQQAEAVKAVKEGLRLELRTWLSNALTSVLGLGSELQNTDSLSTVDAEGTDNATGGIDSPSKASLLDTKWSERKVSSNDHSTTYIGWRTAIEAIEEARYIFPNPKPLLYQTPTRDGALGVDVVPALTRRSKDGNGIVKMDISSEVHPNYALFLHACLMASMASYNLDLLPPSFIEGLMKDIRFYDQSPVTTMSSDNNDDDDMKASSLDLQDPQVTFPSITPDMDESEIEAAMIAAEAQQQAFAQAQIEEEAKRKQEKEEQVWKGVEHARRLGEDKAKRMSRMALGYEEAESVDSRVEIIASDKACAVVSIDHHKKIILVAFRGTKDSMDVITDINFVSQPFEALNNRINTEYASSDSYVKEYGDIEVHAGFLSAFESIATELSQVIQCSDVQGYNVIFTGHSMGGALAQLAAAYFKEVEPYLITFAAPAIGNGDFVKYMNTHVQPYGGIRVWNEYDSVPYLALLVGYDLPGIPIKRPLSQKCKDLFKEHCSNDIAKGMDVIMPHILYQIGPIVYTFPVLGQDMYSASTAELL